MTDDDFRLRVEGKITAEEYVNRLDERIRLRHEHYKDRKMGALKPCPRCGRPGCLIHCPDCHGTRP